MIEYDEKNFSMEELENNLPNGNYFVRLKSHVFLPTGPPIKKENLLDYIRKRGWENESVVIENGNLEFIRLERGERSLVTQEYYDSNDNSDDIFEIKKFYM